MNNSYGMVLARSVDILACSWIWRDYDITISSMAGLEMRKPKPKLWARILGGALNLLQNGHCEMAIAADKTRAQGALQTLG